MLLRWISRHLRTCAMQREKLKQENLHCFDANAASVFVDFGFYAFCNLKYALANDIDHLFFHKIMAKVKRYTLLAINPSALNILIA